MTPGRSIKVAFLALSAFIWMLSWDDTAPARQEAVRLQTVASDAREQARPQMDRYRMAHPRCEACGARPGPNRGNEVHHLVPCATDPERAGDTNNMITLCRPCHIAYGHAGDGACRVYVENVRQVIDARVVITNRIPDQVP